MRPNPLPTSALKELISSMVFIFQLTKILYAILRLFVHDGRLEEAIERHLIKRCLRGGCPMMTLLACKLLPL